MSMDIHTNLISWLNGVGSLLKDIGSSLQKQLFDVFSTNWNNCSPSTALNASFNFGHKGRWVNQVHQCFTKTASDLGDGPSSTVAAPPAGWVWWDGQPTRPGSGWVRLRVSRSGPGRASKSMLLQSSSRYNIFAVFQKKKKAKHAHTLYAFLGFAFLPELVFMPAVLPPCGRGAQHGCATLPFFLRGRWGGCCGPWPRKGGR